MVESTIDAIKQVRNLSQKCGTPYVTNVEGVGGQISYRLEVPKPPLVEVKHLVEEIMRYTIRRYLDDPKQLIKALDMKL
jgi:hypothetical protein